MKKLRLFVGVVAAVGMSLAAQAAPRPVRLYEIFAVRIVVNTAGRQMLERGLLDSLGEFRVVDLSAVPESVVVPPEALNRHLITTGSWYAYEILGPHALGNFKLGSTLIYVGAQMYFTVGVADEPKLDLGELVNISTRATVTPGAEPVIGGFVVEGSSRWVLIRGIGPGLSDFGVASPLADPLITLHKHGSDRPIAVNDDWGQRLEADVVAVEQAAIATGAFPLQRTSKDAACLIELAPGAYTVQLTTAGATAGTALLEVYTVP